MTRQSAHLAGPPGGGAQMSASGPRPPRGLRMRSPADHRSAIGSAAEIVPPQAFFLISAVFHYLGPAFAVLLFARVEVLGVAWLRIASAAVILGAWRRPLRVLRGNRTLLAWGAVLAAMNCCFYEAIARLPLGTVAAIEFLPVVLLAAVGVRSSRNALALALAAAGVYELSHVQLTAQPLGFAFAFANAALFAT